jgi:hypothetical protein
MFKYIITIILSFLFSVNIAQGDLIDLRSGNYIESINDLTITQIVSSSVCYEGNRTSTPVEIAREIRNHNFHFEELRVLNSWAYVPRGGEIEIICSSSIGGSYNIFTGISLIRNCEDLRL